ncbi:hypothetical protein [Paraburkholderia tuberum]|uniref:Uncharacterized protein n=1 Tax=Paraburkholderia tuberum TaxID=157910 RepID=A0A1H1KKU8_9BURK|nr:hypothetical protein [Paraburkholderia tuberum]SDR62866.1 hypothetical protein SAMN05445850_8479 [Paraburkholderia tuberum]
MNGYELITHGRTSGWNPETDAVNAVNFYGMRPVEVAAQAGDVREFAAIVAHPDFDPTGARPHYFADVGRLSDGDGDARFARLRPELDAYKSRFVSRPR